MVVTQQFLECIGSKLNLDYLLQLVYISVNLFSSFEHDNSLLALKLKENSNLSEPEKKKILSYFLDLIENLSIERCMLSQDPTNPLKYFLIGGE